MSRVSVATPKVPVEVPTERVSPELAKTVMGLSALSFWRPRQSHVPGPVRVQVPAAAFSPPPGSRAAASAIASIATAPRKNPELCLWLKFIETPHLKFAVSARKTDLRTLYIKRARFNELFQPPSSHSNPVNLFQKPPVFAPPRLDDNLQVKKHLGIQKLFHVRPCA